MTPWSLRSRLTAAVLVLVSAILAAFVSVLFIGARRAAWQQHDTAQLVRARAFASLAEYDDDGYELKLPADLSPADSPTYLEVWTSTQTVVVRSPSLVGGDLARSNAPGIVARDVTLPDGRAGRAIELAFLPRDEGGRTHARALTLVLAEGVEDVDAALASVRTWFVIAGVLGLVIVGACTAWLVAYHLRPLARLASELERIDDRNLATRVAIDGQPVELAAPITKLNELFARLEASFAREREFTADVSHELRTPLAGLRTMLEVTRITDRSVTEHREVVASALEIVVQLGALVENLLALARLDHGRLELDERELGLRALVDECWRPHAELAGKRSLGFANRIAATSIVTTDRDKLRIVVTNLLANAAEYTTPGGWVEVSSNGDAIIEVTDSGPAIPPDHLERIFDRLWRGDAARSSTGVHCGIGLALARCLCERLGLSLHATSRPDGSVRFTVARAGRAAPSSARRRS